MDPNINTTLVGSTDHGTVASQPDCPSVSVNTMPFIPDELLELLLVQVQSHDSFLAILSTHPMLMARCYKGAGASRSILAARFLGPKEAGEFLARYSIDAIRPLLLNPGALQCTAVAIGISAGMRGNTALVEALIEEGFMSDCWRQLCVSPGGGEGASEPIATTVYGGRPSQLVAGATVGSVTANVPVTLGALTPQLRRSWSGGLGDGR